MSDGVLLTGNLINQLVGGDDKSKKKTKRTKPKPRESKQLQDNTAVNEAEIQKGPPAAGWPLQTPLFVPTPQPLPSSNPQVESIRSMLKESESILEKLKAHEENMLKEVTQRAKELHEKEFKLPQQKTIVCQPEQNACEACYKEHINDSLKCSTIVSSYQECVRRARRQAKLPG